MDLRRQFDLLQQDQQFLEEYGLPWETIVDGSQWVLLHRFPSQNEGYNNPEVTIAIRLETGYPNTQLDMVYFFPPIFRKDGRAIGASQVEQIIDGKTYQRWSRHRTEAHPWTPGRDGLGSHVILIEDWLAREFERWPHP